MSLTSRLTEWIRQNVFKSLAAALVAGVGGAWGTLYTLEQTRLNRFEDRMLSEYEKVAGSEQAVAINLDKLSYRIATGKKADEDLKRELSSELVKMYVALDTFKMGLDADGANRISSYQAALTDLKTEIIKTKKVSDLQYLASRLADTQRAFSSAKPVIEQQIGVSLIKG